MIETNISANEIKGLIFFKAFDSNISDKFKKISLKNNFITCNLIQEVDAYKKGFYTPIGIFTSNTLNYKVTFI